MPLAAANDSLAEALALKNTVKITSALTITLCLNMLISPLQKSVRLPA